MLKAKIKDNFAALSDCCNGNLKRPKWSHNLVTSDGTFVWCHYCKISEKLSSISKKNFQKVLETVTRHFKREYFIPELGSNSTPELFSWNVQLIRNYITPIQLWTIISKTLVTESQRPRISLASLLRCFRTFCNWFSNQTYILEPSAISWTSQMKANRFHGLFVLYVYLYRVLIYMVYCVVYVAVISSCNDFCLVFTAGVLAVRTVRAFVEAETECLFELLYTRNKTKVLSLY